MNKDIFEELNRGIWLKAGAVALLRAAYGDVKNRDLQLHYETSFASKNIVIDEMHASTSIIPRLSSEVIWSK